MWSSASGYIVVRNKNRVFNEMSKFSLGMTSVPVALVCGATSALGKAVVRRLAFAGYKVAAAGECANAAGKIAEDNKKVGGKVTAFAVDVNNAEHRKELLEKVQQELGGLDTVVIVPPKNTIRGDIMDTTSMQFDSVMESFVTVPFRIVQSAIPLLSKSENGSVVLITSAAGYSPQVDGGLFSVASTSVLALTKALAQSAAKQNVRVNAVCTGMMEGDGSGAVWDEPSGEQAEQLKQSLQAMIPLGRLGRPSDAASVVEFLISERAKYITGENCLLNGGVSFRM